MKEDKILYKEFLDGNKKSFEEIILRYKSNLIFFITRYVKNIETAEDIFQDIVLYILENKDYYNFDYSFKTYIYMIAKSKTIDFIKKKKNIDSIDDSNFEIEDAKLLEEIILTKDRQKKIQSVMKKMLPEYQLVIYLTQIEGLSYKDTALIMNKKESQIKTLSFNARKKLRQLMLDEKVVELKGNKLIKLLSWFIVISIVTSTIVYASVTIYNKIKANLTPIYSGMIGENDMNTIWIGSFQLAWNEFIEYMGFEIEFEEESQMIIELNKQLFTKDMLSKDDYYVKVGKTNLDLKDEIKEELKEKFNMDEKNLLNKLDFRNNDNSITIYSVLKKDFEFLHKFDELKSQKFNNENQKVKYFGINNQSDEILNENVEVMFFEYGNDEFAVKLNSKENEEIILYRTNKNDSFENLYKDVLDLENSFEGIKQFTEHDQIKIPYINLDAVINYDDLCNKVIKNTNGLFIQNALQNIKFSLNESGANILSESSIKAISMSGYSDTREFNFDSNFVIFIKEKEKGLPYFALKIDGLDILTVDN